MSRNLSKLPFKQLIYLVVIISLAEIVLEVILNFITIKDPFFKILINCFFLILFMVPAMYFFIIRPMIAYIGQIKKTEAQRQVQYDIVHGLVFTNNLYDLLSLIHHSLSKVIYAENCFIALYDKSINGFIFPYSVDKYDETPPSTPLDKSYTSYVFRTGKGMIHTNQLFDELSNLGEVELVGTPSASWIGVPIATAQGVIGVIALQNYEKENVYNEEDLNFLNAIGSQVAGYIEQKRTEEALKAREFEIDKYFNMSLDLLCIADSDGNFIRLNPEWEKVLGYRINELEGQKISRFIHDDDLPATYDALSKLNQQEEVLHFENRYICFDGTYKWIEWRARPSGKFIYAVARDITNRKLAEQALKKSEARLTEINATKDRFFSIISHDLKSPFSGILGFSEILMEKAKSEDYEEIEVYAGIIKDSASRALDLLQNLLEWANSQTGRIEYNPETFNLKDLINRVVELLENGAVQKSVSISASINKDIQMYADKSMIATVLRNLLSNAIKFTDVNGSIKITVLSNEEYIKVSIVDSGVGIKPENIEKLFSLESNYTTYGTNKEKGTGLGLVLCKEFIEKNKGTISVESSENGSTFSFTIPHYLA